MNFIGNSARVQGGAISVRAPSVAIDSNILPIFNTRCFIEYEVTTEPFSLDPVLWEVMSCSLWEGSIDSKFSVFST